MAGRSPGSHRESGVEEQDTLVRPVLERAVIGDRAAQIAGELFVDVHQRRWRLDSGAHREAKAVCLARPVIGVLAQDQGFHRCIRSEMEGREDLIGWRVDLVRLTLRGDEVHEVGPIGLFELSGE